jgi:hypothetical protein
MNYGSLADWFVAFGTILLGLIAIFQDRMRAYLRSPKLDCEIELNPPDCHRTITQIITDSSMRVGCSFYTYYYRFKIWNKGKVSAEKVEVIVTDIFRKEGKNYKRIESFSLDNLVWSTPGEKGERKVYCDYISPDTYKYCNLGHIHDPTYRDEIPGEFNPTLPVKKDEAIFCFDVYFRSNILYYLVAPGTYKIKIMVGCTNAKTISKEYELKVTEKWFEDELRMLNEGLYIMEIQ